MTKLKQFCWSSDRSDMLITVIVFIRGSIKHSNKNAKNGQV